MLLHGLVFTRPAIIAPHAVKSAFRAMVATYIRLGWLDSPANQFCVICFQRAEAWHHPAYERGFHDVVQPVCDRCHQRYHNLSIRWFASSGGTWHIWRRGQSVGVVDALVDQMGAVEDTAD